MVGYFYGDIVGLEAQWKVGFDRTSPPGGASAKEKSSTRQRLCSCHQQLLRQPRRMMPAPPTSLPRLLQVRKQKLAPAILRQARAQWRARRLLSQAAAVDEK